MEERRKKVFNSPKGSQLSEPFTFSELFGDKERRELVKFIDELARGFLGALGPPSS